MRGSPLLRALLAFLVLAGLGFPLHRLLQAVERAPSIPSPLTSASGTPAPAEKSKLHVQITFTSPPSSFRLLSLGEPVWTDSAPAVEITRDLPIEFPAEGIELVLEAEWPADARAAARVVVTDPQGTAYEKIAWGGGTVSRVLSFP